MDAEPRAEPDPLTTGDPPPQSNHGNIWIRILVAVWLLLVAAGLLILMAYANRPGQRGQTPENWPRETALRHAASRPTLLVFAHPKCPCTRATIDELAWIMTRCGDNLDCRVLFVQPEDQSSEWVRGGAWQAASSIPGVTIREDPQGVNAKLFGARTSGHSMLYDAAGRLVFEGGITPSRGHRGDNFGREQIVALIATDDTDRSVVSTDNSQMESSPEEIDSTCVFGCPLFSSARLSTPSDRSISEP